MKMVSNVSIGDHLHEMSKPLFWENRENISVCSMMNFLPKVLNVDHVKTKSGVCMTNKWNVCYVSTNNGIDAAWVGGSVGDWEEGNYAWMNGWMDGWMEGGKEGVAGRDTAKLVLIKQLNCLLKVGLT